MWINFYLSLMCFFLSSLMISFFFKHILLTLISLEFMMINMIWNIYNLLNFLMLNSHFITIIISMSICESIMGLTLMTFMIRNYGNDYSKTLSLIKW